MVENRLSKAHRYFDSHGLRNLDENEVVQVVESYKQDLLRGFNGEPGALAMYPSHLQPADLSRVRDGATALVTEVGGTNGYAALVTLDRGSLRIQKQIEWKLGRTDYRNAPDFFESITTPLTPLLDGTRPDALALIYSFPGETFRTARGVDVLSPESLPKDFVIPGISESPVGQSYLETLHRRYNVSQDMPLSVMNDTVAVLFSTSHAGIGGVIGTGYNLAVNTPDGVRNTESGAFDKLPSTEFDSLVDAQDNKPGTQLSEKRISGKFLGMGVGVAVEGLQREGLLVGSASKVAAKSETISYLLEGDIQGVEHEDLGVLKLMAVRLRDRSAQLAGLMVGTAVNTFPEQFSGSGLIVPIEGSVFWPVPGYKEVFAIQVGQTTGKQVHLVQATGRLGAAGAALSLRS
jgi:hexokinase